MTFAPMELHANARKSLFQDLNFLKLVHVPLSLFVASAYFITVALFVLLFFQSTRCSSSDRHVRRVFGS